MMSGELFIQFTINLLASIIGASIALYINRRWKKQTLEEIKKLKESLKYYIKKYGEHKNGET